MNKAKDKPKKGKKADQKSAVPKKVAGVKVPRQVRESKSLATLLTSGLGREILADALIAAAGAAAAALTRTRAAQEAGQAVAQASTQAASATGDAVQTAAGAVANVVSEAARTFLPASLVGDEKEPPKPRYINRSADHSSRKRSKGGSKKKAEKKAGE